MEAHGTFQEATCTNSDCKKKYSIAEMKKASLKLRAAEIESTILQFDLVFIQVESAVLADKVPTCDACTGGVVKPNVVFFGEDLPGRFKELIQSDFEECDLLVVMGTSLQVQPFSGLVERVKQTTPRLLVCMYVCIQWNFLIRDTYFVHCREAVLV